MKKYYNLTQSYALDSRLWKKPYSYQIDLISENSLVLNTLSMKECIYYLNLLSSLDSLNSEYSKYIYSEIFSSE